MSPARAWSGRSRGGKLGTALVALVARWGGRDLCYLFVLFPALWFAWRDAPSRRAILAYWRALQPRRPRCWIASRIPWHFWTFARGLADRFLDALSPGCIHYRNVGMEQLSRALADGRGAILLSAHLGSFALAARWLSQQVWNLPRLQVVMLDAEDPQVRSQLQRSMGDQAFGIIDLADPTAAGLAIAAALGRGEICCMLGDRSAGAAAGMRRLPFLGRSMAFPTGPFIAAAASGAPIVVTFCIRSSWATWTCAADAPWRIDLGPRRQRQARLEAVMLRWSRRLELEVRRHPYAWNNYYDVFTSPEDGTLSRQSPQA